MRSGWIKLHRSFLDWEWYHDKNVKDVFLHLMLTVNYDKKRWQGIDIYPGQIVTSRKNLAAKLDYSEQQVRTILNKLKSTSEITIKSTNKYTIITLLNWDNYQMDTKNNQQNTNKTTNEQPTNNQQVTTTKEVKKERKKELNISFSQFKEKYPLQKVGFGPVAKCEKKWNSLTDAKRKLALEACDPYRQLLEQNPWQQSKQALAWINGELWTDYEAVEEKPEISPEEAERRTQRAMERHREECRKREEDKSQDWRYR